MRDWGRIVDNLDDVIKATTEWREEKGFDTGWMNFSEKLMLIMTEVSEAADAAANATEALGMLLAPRKVKEIKEFANTLGSHAMNYVEEWVDTMVRVADLAGACDLRVTIEPSPGDAQEGSLPLGEVFERRADLHVVEALRQATGAMEVFRDVRLLVVPGGDLGPENPDHKAELGKWLSGILSVAAWAIEGLGEDWRPHYAAKMKRNEARPVKHGRQR